MRIPESVMARVAGPLLAGALAGCSSAPAIEAPAAVRPEPSPVVADPVAYDMAEEQARLARLEQSDASAEDRRARRIAADPGLSFGVLGIGHHHVLPGCGRG